MYGRPSTCAAGTNDLLAWACHELDRPVLVAEARPDGTLTCLAANRRFADRFAGGTDPRGRRVDELLAAPAAAALADAAAAVRQGRQDVLYLEPADNATGPARETTVRVSLPADAPEPDAVVVAWSGSEQRPDEQAGDGVLGPLAEANRNLEAVNRELSRSNFDLNQFAYVASHDLVEPLRMVTSYLDLLSERYAADLDDRALQYIHFATDGAVRMRALIDDLLTLAKVSSFEGRIDDVDLAVLAEQVAVDLGLRIDEAGATVRIASLPVVRGAASQLARALTNLVANAVKFHRPEVPPVVTISADRTDAGWRVTVADNGIGIKPEFRAQVFDMFRRLHPRSAYPGTGMGLAIAKKIVERHGGEMGVEPTPDGGSAFWFTLPDPLPTAEPDTQTERGHHAP